MEALPKTYKCSVSTCRYSGSQSAVNKHYSRSHLFEKIQKYMNKAYDCDECNFRFSHRQSLNVHKKKCQEITKNRLIRELRQLANHDIKPTLLLQDPIVIECDVRVHEIWEELHKNQLLRSGTLFRAVVMDPPWQLNCFELPYDCLSDKQIKEIPMHLIQDEGYLFMWVTNGKPEVALSFFKKHNYRWVETIVWIKTNKSGNIYKGPGRYIQHGMELCFVGVKGSYENNKSFSKMKTSINVIVEPMRLMSQKPEGIYKIVEKLVPGGPYFEIFGISHNIRKGWTTMGNQLCYIFCFYYKKLINLNFQTNFTECSILQGQFKLYIRLNAEVLRAQYKVHTR
ncbi:MT-A70 family protein [Oxytricha trifallax]|uniref:mRNA m(6)A methyltransferase n=1 Tax=Oxytricha trifallax TaxID=1172189 RepID=A0A073HWM5_9SPIT|nr:MT-A70 family protein [Oxytricha trifallax]